MRLNQYLAHNSQYSRREADRLINEGCVKINHRIAKLGDSVYKNDKIFVNGQFIKEKDKNQYSVIIYHKPKGEIVSKKDDRGRRIIYDSLPSGFSHFIPVGRLDFASNGLLMLTDSPMVAQKLMHSSLERIYYLKIKGYVNEQIKRSMLEGLKLEDARAGGHRLNNIQSMEFAPFTGFEIIQESGGYTRLKVGIVEGQNRELRRFFAAFDTHVMDIKRVRFGFASLGKLALQKWRFLEKSEYTKLHHFLKKESE
ncbi:pseudouridine synthase [Helicobacter monodelphidis]|uniref:pseudouridine synthase n=1 Tax=Helicobacter sp. 15-1451 TaxID=2004995 RepID=UPI000DCAE777|nr:pseudouridine synthase [Helicobacter sp. 15-1451]RAX57401.1 pseudouridine synthase [Helicobacter sp. 15-1451]